ncbi:hypothetical protein ACGFR8_31465 [Streptomyces brevispora]|uniref:hypothetical protein n=1 Tax=Streptomyces brevispora TaxID=887462 RepID=UPI0037195311
MEITIKVPDPAPPEIIQAVADLVARIGAGATVTTDTEWTVDRAEKLLRQIQPHTRNLIVAAVEGDGFADGAAFRARHGENSLKGPSQSITKAVKSGAELGYWGRSMTSPIAPTTPDKNGWSKTGGYYLDKSLVPVFAQALATVQQSSGQAGRGEAE